MLAAVDPRVMSGICLAVALLLLALALGGPKRGRPFKLSALLLLLSYPWDARAADAPSPFSTEGQSWTGVITSEAGTSTPVFGARVEARWRSGRLQLAGRLDALAEKAGVDIDRPETYTQVEGFGLASYDVVGLVSAAGAYGLTRPTLGVDGAARSTWLAGVLVGTRERWVLVGFGQRRSLGNEACGMVAFRANAIGKTGLVGDLAARRVGGKLTYVARVGAAVTLWGQP